MDAAKAQELTATGKSLLLGEGVGQDPTQAVAVLNQAVEAGSGQAAALLAVLAGAGVGRTQSWPDALDYLVTAAELGELSAQRQLAVLANDHELATRIDTRDLLDPAVWKRARGNVNLQPWFDPAPAGIFSREPRAAVLPGFLSPTICSWLIKRGEEELTPALIYDPSTGAARSDAKRTNSYSFMSLAKTDVIVLLVQAKIAAATGFAFTRMEPPNILCYEVGQEFGLHYDFLDAQVARMRKEIDIIGQRVATFLVYLNGDFEGGETDFPSAGLRHRGKPGGALLFYNVRPDGEADLDSRHAGLPVTKGRKWLLSQWIRNKPQLIA